MGWSGSGWRHTELTMPSVTEFCKPSGLPIAITNSPGCAERFVANGNVENHGPRPSVGPNQGLYPPRPVWRPTLGVYPKGQSLAASRPLAMVIQHESVALLPQRAHSS